MKHLKGALDCPYSEIRIYSGLFQNSHFVRMSIKRLFHFWNNGRRFTRRKVIPLEHFTKYVVVRHYSQLSSPSSFNLLRLCAKVWILRDILISSHTLFSYNFHLLTASFVPFVFLK